MNMLSLTNILGCLADNLTIFHYIFTPFNPFYSELMTELDPLLYFEFSGFVSQYDLNHRQALCQIGAEIRVRRLCLLHLQR